MRSEFLVFGKPRIEEEDIAEVVATLRSGWIGMGPRTIQFERDFAAYTGAKHAIAVNSCTAALHLALLAAGVGPGDEVITTPLTFAATANVIEHTGATPVFADIDRRTQILDPARVAEKITPRTKAIVPVHMLGRPAPMDPLLDLARQHNLAIIEDAAHAVETVYRGRHVGTIGHFTAFSFYANKNVTTGEGGMLTTDDDAAADHARRLRLHGISKDAWKRYSSEGFTPYELVEPGFKYNMLDLTAALGLGQLRRVEENWTIRERLVALYNEGLAEVPGLTIPALEPLEAGRPPRLAPLPDPDRSRSASTSIATASSTPCKRTISAAASTTMRCTSRATIANGTATQRGESAECGVGRRAHRLPPPLASDGRDGCGRRDRRRDRYHADTPALSDGRKDRDHQPRLRSAA